MFELRIGGKPTGIRIRPDGLYPGMWRVMLPGDRLGPMGNLSLVKASAMRIARPRGRGNAVVQWQRSQNRFSGGVAGKIRPTQRRGA
jgi:hypothetical protein